MGTTTIDLSRWNITTPQNKIIQTAELNAGWSDPLCFIRNASGTLTFRADTQAEGVSPTANSEFPRAELRETLANGDDREANWRLDSKDHHRIKGRFWVDSVSASGKLIFVQSHGSIGPQKNHPPFKAQFSMIPPAVLGSIIIQYRNEYGGSEKKLTLFKDKVRVGKNAGKIEYDIDLTRSGHVTLKFSLEQDGQTIYEDLTFELNPAEDQWGQDAFYFKAGCYSQDVAGSRPGVGQVTYSKLAVSHYDDPVVIPTDPETPNDPTPTDPTDPTSPGGTEPTVPGDGTHPGDGTDPGQGTDPDDGSSGGGETPPEPTDPVEPGSPADPETPQDPETPVEPGTPVDPTPGDDDESPVPVDRIAEEIVKIEGALKVISDAFLAVAESLAFIRENKK